MDIIFVRGWLNIFSGGYVIYFLFIVPRGQDPSPLEEQDDKPWTCRSNGGGLQCRYFGVFDR